MSEISKNLTHPYYDGVLNNRKIVKRHREIWESLENYNPFHNEVELSDTKDFPPADMKNVLRILEERKVTDKTEINKEAFTKMREEIEKPIKLHIENAEEIVDAFKLQVLEEVLKQGGYYAAWPFFQHDFKEEDLKVNAKFIKEDLTVQLNVEISGKSWVVDSDKVPVTRYGFSLIVPIKEMWALSENGEIPEVHIRNGFFNGGRR